MSAIYFKLPSGSIVQYDAGDLTRDFDGIDGDLEHVEITATLSPPTGDGDRIVNFAAHSRGRVPTHIRAALLEMWADDVGYFAGDTLEEKPVYATFFGTDDEFQAECDRLKIHS